MRLGLLGTAASVTLSAGILCGWMWIAASSTTDSPDWRTRDLPFLKSVHDRVQAELARQPNSGGEASLRREQQSLLLAMEAVAKPMPRETIPSDVRALLPAAEA